MKKTLLADAANAVGADGEALLQIEGQTVEIGRVAMDGVNWLTLSCAAVQRPGSAARIEVFADDSAQPVAQTAYTSSTDPEAIVIRLPEMEGVHNLRVKMSGARYSLRSATLSENPTGIDAVTADPARPTGVYRIDGVKVEGPLQPGFYIIDGEKRMVK